MRLSLQSMALQSIAVRSLTAALALLFSVTLAAQTIDRSDPEKLLQQATDELLAISKAARDYVDQDRKRYYGEAEKVLDQVIATDYFARGVMATYASARLYRSLATDAEKKAFRERVERFSQALEQVLIAKYADALLAFDGERIDIERIDNGAEAAKANLMQTIYDKSNQTYKVQYNLHQQKDGSWLISNVIVEGVNLGATYRNQFAEAVEKNRGDVDYVVNHWTELMAPAAAGDK